MMDNSTLNIKVEESPQATSVDDGTMASAPPAEFNDDTAKAYSSRLRERVGTKTPITAQQVTQDIKTAQEYSDFRGAVEGNRVKSYAASVAARVRAAEGGDAEAVIAPTTISQETELGQLVPKNPLSPPRPNDPNDPLTMRATGQFPPEQADININVSSGETANEQGYDSPARRKFVDTLTLEGKRRISNIGVSLWGRGVKDVLKGVATAPTSVETGILSMANEVIDTAGQGAGIIGDAIYEGGQKLGFSKEQMDSFFESDGKITRESLNNFSSLISPVYDQAQAYSSGTVTGDLFKAGVQFIMPYKFLSAKASEIASIIGVGGKKAVDAIMADLIAFDENDQGIIALVNAIEDPKTKAIVQEYLSPGEGDTVLEGKFKQAIRALAMGAVGEAIINSGITKKAVEFFKIKNADPTAIDIPRDKLERKALFNSIIGSTEEETVLKKGWESIIDDAVNKDKLRTTAHQKMKSARAETKGLTSDDVLIPDEDESENFLNFENMHVGEDIKDMIDTVANHIKLTGPIRESRRGVRSKKATIKSALEGAYDAVGDLLSRRVGDAWNAEQTVAARIVFNNSAKQLYRAAQIAASPVADIDDQYLFRRMLSIHQAIQKEVLGLRAEAGRALQSWNIPVGGTAQQVTDMLSSILNQYGGETVSSSLARKIVIGIKSGKLTPTKLNKITDRGAWTSTMDAVTEIYKLSIVSGIKTHITNIASGPLMGVAAVGTRGVMAALPGSPVKWREVSALAYGMITAQKEGYLNAAEAFTREVPSSVKQLKKLEESGVSKAARAGHSGPNLNTHELSPVRATSRETLDNAGVWAPLAWGLDFIGHKMTPIGSALGAEDQYAKTFLYRGEVRALATREGIDLGLDGVQLKKFVEESIDNPSEQIQAAANRMALKNTFNEALTGTAADIQDLLYARPELRFVVPFLRTPMNIFNFAVDMSPLSMATKRYKDDVAAGGAREAQAKAKLGIGIGLMAVTSDMVVHGNIVGAGPQDKRGSKVYKDSRERLQMAQYSLRIKGENGERDTYHSFKWMGPFDILFSFSSDITEIMMNYETYDTAQQQDLWDIATGMSIAIGNLFREQPYLQGAASFIKASEEPDRAGEYLVGNILSGMVPYSGLLKSVEEFITPEVTQIMSMSDAIRAKIPGASMSSKPRRNTWGEVIEVSRPKSENPVIDGVLQVASVFDPARYTKEVDSPIDRYFFRTKLGIEMPTKTQTFQGVKIDLTEYPEIYDYLVRQRGQEIKIKFGDKQYNMKEYMNSLIVGEKSKEFFATNDTIEEQRAFISTMVGGFSKGALAATYNEYSKVISSIIQDRQANKKQQNANM